MKESISSNVAEVFYSKRTRRALGHLGNSGTQALEAHEHLKDTWALQVLEALYLADPYR